DEAHVAQIATAVCLDRLDLHGVVGRDDHLPVAPQSPAMRKGVGDLNLQDAGPLPVPTPPKRGVQAVHARFPPRSKMVGYRPVELLHHTRACDTQHTAWLQEASQ